MEKYSGIENRQSRRKRMPRNEAVARRAKSIFETTLNVEKDDAGGDEHGGGERANMQGGRGGVQVRIPFALSGSSGIMAVQFNRREVAVGHGVFSTSESFIE